jgi:threonine dehydrogenase-like Zn-dependent dehydrogenase
MKALQLDLNQDIRVVDAAEPEPKTGEVIVEVEWCGICGSDLAEYRSGPLAVQSKMIPQDKWKPMTLGHEIVGRIKYAPEASDLKQGDPAVINPATFCKTCERCQEHGTAACRKIGSMGLSGGHGGQHGGLTQYVAVDARKAYLLPDTIPLDHAALIEPMCVAWHAVKTPGFDSYEGKTTLVIGSGPVG